MYPGGVIALDAKRILSWPDCRQDKQRLRIWDRRSGTCIQVLEGHTMDPAGAAMLNDDQILSWSFWHVNSRTRELRIWDANTGNCLAVFFPRDATRRRPDLVAAHFTLSPFRGYRVLVRGQAVAWSDVFFAAISQSTFQGQIIAGWAAACELETRVLLTDGTLVVTQDDGQVCFLKLHYGQRRVSLAEAEALLASQRKKAE